MRFRYCRRRSNMRIDLGEPVRAVVVRIGDRWARCIPITILGEWRDGAQRGEHENAERSRQYRNDGHLDLLLLNLLANVFRCSTDHQTADEYGDDGVEQHAVQAGPYSSEDHLIGLNIEQWNQATEWCEAIVHPIDGTATSICGHSC